MKNKREKTRKSGPAVIMDAVIILSLALAAVCFGLYYGGALNHWGVELAGIVSFTIFYQCWLRLFLSDLFSRADINYGQWWFRERAFEKNLYKLLRVKKWKGKALTFRPELFDVKTRTPREMAEAMTRAEFDHWMNVGLSFVMIFFSLIWGYFWAFFIASLLVMIFDVQFILIQRYNRPRVLKLAERVRAA